MENHSENESERTEQHPSLPMGFHLEQLDRRPVQLHQGSTEPSSQVLGDRKRSRSQWDSSSSGLCDYEDQESLGTDEESSWHTESAFGESSGDESASSDILQEGWSFRRARGVPWEYYQEFRPRSADGGEESYRQWPFARVPLGPPFLRHGEIPTISGNLLPDEEQTQGEEEAKSGGALR